MVNEFKEFVLKQEFCLPCCLIGKHCKIISIPLRHMFLGLSWCHCGHRVAPGYFSIIGRENKYRNNVSKE